jgi:neutral ceramidase
MMKFFLASCKVRSADRVWAGMNPSVFLMPVLLVMTLLPARAEWQGAAAEVDITPLRPVRLSGYGSRKTPHEGVKQPIFARALVLQWDAEMPLTLVTVDNCGISSEQRLEVLNKLLAQGLAIADSHFSVHSTHTHCAPMLRGVLPYLFGADLSAEETAEVEAYTDRLTEQMMGIIQQAHASLRPVRVDHGIGQVAFATNRRDPAVAANPDTPVKNSPVDHDLPLLRVQDETGRVLAIFTSYACHCTTISWNWVHGDWAGSAALALKEAFPDAIPLIAIGCGADQNPHPRRREEFLEIYGRQLADEAARLVGSERLRPIRGPVVARTASTDLPFEGGRSREDWLALSTDGNAFVAYHAQRFLADLDAGREIPQALDYFLQVWGFGEDLLMVNLQGEVVVDYGLRLKQEHGRERTWVNGYSNGVPCYIPSQRVWEEGGYEADRSMIYYARPTRFASGVEERIFTALKPLLP